jgi:Na+/glutamate symporter
MKLKETIAITIGALAFMLITGVAKANPITNWLTNEKNKIVEYQTKSWADSKVQLAQTKESIVNLFNKAKDNVTQD